jgi:hypothetical protein
MSKDIIYREDAIKAINARSNWYQVTCNGKQIAVMLMAKDVNEILEKVPSADRPQEWIPCRERLPEDSGDYLVCPSDSVLEDYSDFSEVMIMPYDADCEAFGWWIERYDPISLGYLDSDFNEFEVLAWMPLPEPWKGADDEISCR